MNNKHKEKTEYRNYLFRRKNDGCQSGYCSGVVVALGAEKGFEDVAKVVVAVELVMVVAVVVSLEKVAADMAELVMVVLVIPASARPMSNGI